MTSLPHVPAARSRTHTERLRVRYAETDQMGVVYYANYLRYYEAARVEWLRAHGIPYKQIEEDGALFPVIEAHTRYRQPARFDDEIDIECTLTKLGAASLRFEYVVRREGSVLAEGWTEHACIDRGGRPRRIPPHVKDKLAA